MAIFRNEPEAFQRLDWILLQMEQLHLYFRPQVLLEDVEWLKRHNYRVNSFECSIWVGESEMHEALSCSLEFPGYYGSNLDALRVVPSLWPLHDAVVVSTLQFSMIRMRNAQSRVAETNASIARLYPETENNS